MSPSTTSASAAPAASAPRAVPGATGALRRHGSRIRQAVAYVALLVWGVPLAAFVVIAGHADATPCVAAGDMPCDDQGVVVLTAVLAATWLIPLGLLAMGLVAILTTALPARAPATLAVVASASLAAVASVVWGISALVAG